MSTLDSWTSAVVAQLDLTGEPDRDLILDLARDVAHTVARPAAPLTAYLAGLAVGAGADPHDVVGRLVALARDWTPAE